MTVKVDKLEAIISDLVKEVRIIRADIESIKIGVTKKATAPIAYTSSANVVAGGNRESDEDSDEHHRPASTWVSPEIHKKRRSIHDAIAPTETENASDDDDDLVRLPVNNETEFMQLNADFMLNEKLVLLVSQV